MANNSILKCPCCKGQLWTKRCYLPKLIFGQGCHIYSCKKCGCGQTYPAPKTDFEFYQNNFTYDELFLSNGSLYLSFAEDLLEFIGNSEQSRRRLLDIGCGGGFLIQAAKDRGFDARGVEANVNMVNWALARNLDVFAGNLDEYVESYKEFFDFIVLSAVIEHVEDPARLLSQSLKLLAPGGLIVISQASFDGLLPVIFPWGWYGWQPDQHYWHFTPNALIKMAENHGLKVERIKRYSLYHPWYFRGGFKNIIGRNLATLISRLGSLLGRGDGFYITLSHSGDSN